MAAAVSIAVLICCGLSGAQTSSPAPASPVPIADEPFHHEAFRNGKVRAFLVELPPHTATRLHRHEHDSLTVILTDGRITDTVAGQKPAQDKVRAGETRMTESGFTHSLRNDGNMPLRALTVEFADDQGQPQASKDPASRYCNPGSKTACVDEKYLLCTAKMCASDVVLGAGAVTTKHGHSTDHMLIAISDYELSDEVEGKGKVMRVRKSGGVEFVPAGITHQLTNTGKAPVRFIVVVFK
jgi:quercetin dioxygenase-like cupin family protein